MESRIAKAHTHCLSMLYAFTRLDICSSYGIVLILDVNAFSSIQAHRRRNHLRRMLQSIRCIFRITLIEAYRDICTSLCRIDKLVTNIGPVEGKPK